MEPDPIGVSWLMTMADGSVMRVSGGTLTLQDGRTHISGGIMLPVSPPTRVPATSGLVVRLERVAPIPLPPVEQLEQPTPATPNLLRSGRPLQLSEEPEALGDYQAAELADDADYDVALAELGKLARRWGQEWGSRLIEVLQRRHIDFVAIDWIRRDRIAQLETDVARLDRMVQELREQFQEQLTPAQVAEVGNILFVPGHNFIAEGAP